MPSERNEAPVAVIGATGQQGGHLAHQLLARGHAVIAITRDPERPAARALRARGATVVQADLGSGAGLLDALAGARSAFLVTTPFEHGAAFEIRQTEQFVRAARALSDRGQPLTHVVMASVWESMARSPIAHFQSKRAAEELLRRAELPLTVIGAPPFFDNVSAPWHVPWLKRGVFAVPGPFDQPMQMVAAVDIAQMAVHVLEHPDEFIGQRIDIASAEISGRAMKTALEAALGRTLEHRPLTFAEIDPKLGELFAEPVELPPGGATGGQGLPPRIDLAELHARYPSVRWHSFADWVAQQDFSGLMGGARHGQA